MELKLRCKAAFLFSGSLLIEPYGIEIRIERLKAKRLDRLLIEPYGIDDRLLIEPYGIEIHVLCRHGCPWQSLLIEPYGIEIWIYPPQKDE